MSSNNLDREIIIRRLATIKYLYSIGVQQSLQVESVAGFSILAFHDCAEKLFNSISTANVKYHKVATYQDLIDGMNAIG